MSDDDSLPPTYDGPSNSELTPEDSLGSTTAATRQVTKAASKSSSTSSSSSSRTRPVVKLVVTSVSRSYSEPWRRRTQRESGGTGFLIGWNEEDDSASVRILTNAHVVRNASSVRARSSFGPHVVNCCVEWISLPLDLALVKISESDYDDFCKGWGFGTSCNGSNGTKELKLLNISSTLPALDENVTCVGEFSVLVRNNNPNIVSLNHL
eukprot:scaffold7802_cov71-Cyclotella_meneghiniana.AAC.14